MKHVGPEDLLVNRRSIHLRPLYEAETQVVFDARLVELYCDELRRFWRKEEVVRFV